ncbi:hypothetical protein EI94DRAFT_1795591 [Lactarius quietus]|nr:hypothetical protein EI94DRAFT_1795591 [Lactarius quietus]
MTPPCSIVLGTTPLIRASHPIPTPSVPLWPSNSSSLSPRLAARFHAPILDFIPARLPTCVESYNGPNKGGPLKVSVTFAIFSVPLTKYIAHQCPDADPMLAAHISPSTDRLSNSLGDPINLYLDVAPTPPSLFTSTKTTHRTHYAEARARLGLPDVEASVDVLLWNTKGMLMETSIRNFALFRHGRWVTHMILPAVFTA